jgi:hypothetical protein
LIAGDDRFSPIEAAILITNSNHGQACDAAFELTEEAEITEKSFNTEERRHEAHRVDVDEHRRQRRLELLSADAKRYLRSSVSPCLRVKVFLRDLRQLRIS